MTLNNEPEGHLIDVNFEIKVDRLDPIQKSRKFPKSLRYAINGKCYDCQGGGFDPGTKEAIRDCDATDCTLHAVRPYQRRGNE